MNKAQQMLIFLSQLIENDKELDFVSDGKKNGFDYHFKDGSKLNINEEV